MRLSILGVYLIIKEDVTYSIAFIDIVVGLHKRCGFTIKHAYGTHDMRATISAIEQWDVKRPDRPTGTKGRCNETICYKIVVGKGYTG